MGVEILEEERKKNKKKERITKQRKKYINTNSALRVPPAETRLTVYRWINIGQNRGSATIDDISIFFRKFS